MLENTKYWQAPKVMETQVVRGPIGVDLWRAIWQSQACPCQHSILDTLLGGSQGHCVQRHETMV